MASFLEQLDLAIANSVSEWNSYTTLLAIILVIVLAYPLLTYADPDTHPLLLSRQSTCSAVRQKHESAVYRSLETPHGFPLKTGLKVKEAGAPRWAGGKDGDLRDVWREVMRGGGPAVDGKDAPPRGSIMTVLGREEVVEHDLEHVSREINVLGKYLQQNGGSKLAIYLPNSVEYLATIFASAFYGLTPVLLPYDQPHQTIFSLLNRTGAESLIATAGKLPLEELAEQCKGLKSVTWVVEKTSRHMDWNGLPENAATQLQASVWHDLVQDDKIATAELPGNDTIAAVGDIVTIWPNAEEAEIVTFTHANLVSATATLLSTLPLRQRLSPADLVLPADSLSTTYTLCYTLGALYSHASLALTSVAGPGVALSQACTNLSPTVILASAATLSALHAQESRRSATTLQRLDRYSAAQALHTGRMPADSLPARLLAPSSSAAADKPSALRLILTAERLAGGTPALSSTVLSDLRVSTRARICYALTASRVAGAIAQTNVFDYRRDEDGAGRSHFGAPVSSVEVKLVSGDDSKVDGHAPEGEIVVTGPAVAGGGEVRVGRSGRFREDCCLVLV